MPKRPSSGAARIAEEGMTLLRAPAHVVAASAGGIEYAVVDGLLEVPTAVFPELLAHGFALVEAE